MWAALRRGSSKVIFHPSHWRTVNTRIYKASYFILYQVVPGWTSEKTFQWQRGVWATSQPEVQRRLNKAVFWEHGERRLIEPKHICIHICMGIGKLQYASGRRRRSREKGEGGNGEKQELECLQRIEKIKNIQQQIIWQRVKKGYPPPKQLPSLLSEASCFLPDKVLSGSLKWM